MERTDAIAALPELYGRALALQEQGMGSPQMAHHLGVPEESIPSLLSLAAAKLARLEATAPHDGTSTEEGQWT